MSAAPSDVTPAPLGEPSPAQPPLTVGAAQPASTPPRRGRRGLTLAFLVSLLMHLLLLSLSLGGVGRGLPGLALPWQHRRIEAPDLHIVLIPARAVATAPVGALPTLPLALPEVEPHSTNQSSLAVGLSPEPPAPHAPLPLPMPQSLLMPTVTAKPGRPISATVPPSQPLTQATAATAAATAAATLTTPRPTDPAAAPLAETVQSLLTNPEAATWSVPALPEPAPTAALAAAPAASTLQLAELPRALAGDAAQLQAAQRVSEQAVELARLERARQEAARLEQRQQEAARLELARDDAARREASRHEALRQTLARTEAARLEAARADAVMQEAARSALARLAAARAEASRLEVAQQEASRQEVARAEAAAAESVRRDAERQAAAAQQSAQQAALLAQPALDAAARREATLRAIGRQLDEEAARRDAAARQSPTVSTARRARLFGRTDANAELALYAEAWSRKIQLNMTFEMLRDVVKQPHTEPLVTVALRSDGSVESVSFVRSSGVAAIDEAVRRIVHSQAPYPVFTPTLAREFDVIEIRRTWYFDMAIRLY